MTTFHKVRGDVADSIQIVLSGVQDLTTAVGVEAHVWHSSTASTTLAATVLDPAARIVEIALGGVTGWLSNATATTWSLETQVSFGNGGVLTWPARGVDQIVVRSGK